MAAHEDQKLPNISFTEAMNTWTKQMGYPPIKIERIDDNHIKLSQNQFLSDPTSLPVEASIYKFKKNCFLLLIKII